MAPSKATHSLGVQEQNFNPLPETPPPAEVLRFPRPWLFELRLQPRALALACAIVQWTLPSKRGGHCFYSARKLGELLGWSQATVKRAFADLRAAGILETARRGRRIVSPVTQHRLNGEPLDPDNWVNGEPTLNQPISKTEPKREREELLKSRSCLPARAEPSPSLDPSEKKELEKATAEPGGEDGEQKRFEGGNGNATPPTVPTSCDTARPPAESVLAELEVTATAEGVELSSSDTVRRKRLWAVKDALADAGYPRGHDRGGPGYPEYRDLRRTVQVVIDDGWAADNGADVIRHALKNAENYATAVTRELTHRKQETEAETHELELDTYAACEHQFEALERTCGCTKPQRTIAAQRSAERLREQHELAGSIDNGTCTRPWVGYRCAHCELETTSKPSSKPSEQGVSRERRAS